MQGIQTPRTRGWHTYWTHATQIKMNKTALNFWFDIALFMLFMATGVTAYTDKQLHQTLGLVMAVSVPVHLWLHWSWIKAVGTRIRQMKPHTRLKLGLNLGMLLVFLLLLFSGLIIMLIWAPTVTAFHTLMVYAFAGLVTAHLALNGKWLISQIKRRLPGN